MSEEYDDDGDYDDGDYDDGDYDGGDYDGGDYDVGDYDDGDYDGGDYDDGDDYDDYDDYDDEPWYYDDEHDFDYSSPYAHPALLDDDNVEDLADVPLVMDHPDPAGYDEDFEFDYEDRVEGVPYGVVNPVYDFIMSYPPDTIIGRNNIPQPLPIPHHPSGLPRVEAFDAFNVEDPLKTYEGDRDHYVPRVFFDKLHGRLVYSPWFHVDSETPDPTLTPIFADRPDTMMEEWHPVQDVTDFELSQHELEEMINQNVGFSVSGREKDRDYGGFRDTRDMFKSDEAPFHYSDEQQAMVKNLEYRKQQRDRDNYPRLFAAQKQVLGTTDGLWAQETIDRDKDRKLFPYKFDDGYTLFIPDDATYPKNDTFIEYNYKQFMQDHARGPQHLIDKYYGTDHLIDKDPPKTAAPPDQVGQNTQEWSRRLFNSWVMCSQKLGPFSPRCELQYTKLSRIAPLHLIQSFARDLAGRASDKESSAASSSTLPPLVLPNPRPSNIQLIDDDPRNPKSFHNKVLAKLDPRHIPSHLTTMSIKQQIDAGILFRKGTSDDHSTSKGKTLERQGKPISKQKTKSMERMVKDKIKDFPIQEIVGNRVRPHRTSGPNTSVPYQRIVTLFNTKSDPAFEENELRLRQAQLENVTESYEMMKDLYHNNVSQALPPTYSPVRPLYDYISDHYNNALREAYFEYPPDPRDSIMERHPFPDRYMDPLESFMAEYQIKQKYGEDSIPHEEEEDYY